MAQDAEALIERRKLRRKLTVWRIAFLLLLAALPVTAYAQSDEPAEDTTPPAQSETTTAKPFTPEGTGTVVDNATDEDGKEFYTITTPSEHVFYLVVDKQRDSENVYFLDAVTEKDLLALAESDGADAAGSTPSTPEARRLENRVPSSDANPYLVIAASLACGYVGLVESLRPTEPLESDAKGLDFELQRGLLEAVAAMQYSEEISNVLGPSFVKTYTAVKQQEFDTFMRVISP